MFIRKTAIRNESYSTRRLVASGRSGKQVRQITLLNPGRHFDLPQADWPRLCARTDAILAGQIGLLAEADAIETMAQRYAAGLIALRPAIAPAAATPPAASDTAAAPSFAHVDVASLQFTRPRSVGVEAVGVAAFGRLGIDRILCDVGFNGVQRAAVAASLIGRMAPSLACSLAPGSELSTWHWLRERSAPGELPGTGFEAMPLMRLYRVSGLLVRHREAIGAALFGRIETLFGLATTVTLYDLTNSHFEGTAAANPSAKRGRSKQKNSDCPLVTLGLVPDGSAFVRRSTMFAGSRTGATCAGSSRPG